MAGLDPPERFSYSVDLLESPHAARMGCGFWKRCGCLTGSCGQPSSSLWHGKQRAGVGYLGTIS